jgi:hypothetical protein
VTPVFAHSRRDGVLVALAAAQGLLGAAFALRPSVLLAAVWALGICWSANTISHNHLHNPLFTRRWMNRALSLYLTVLLGIPQRLWKVKHAWHHAGEPRRGLAWRSAWNPVEAGLLAATWSAAAMLVPEFFVLYFLPAYGAGLLLCSVQGHFEHARSGTHGTSCYGWAYNVFWFNDGHHAEHHREPRRHWTQLTRAADSTESRYAPLLRWLELVADWVNHAQARALVMLERIALRARPLQRFLLERHERALRSLLEKFDSRSIERAAIVGGGLFPRTALVLRRLLPRAELVVIDSSAQNIERAQRFLEAEGHAGHGVGFVHRSFTPSDRQQFDLVVIPLGYRGDRASLYAPAGRARLLVHDWLWRVRGDAGALVSLLLLKRVNLVTGQSPPSREATS